MPLFGSSSEEKSLLPDSHSNGAGYGTSSSSSALNKNPSTDVQVHANHEEGCSQHDDEVSHTSGKSIGTLGSIAIAVNSLAGPAILQLPFQYQQSGIIPTTACLVAVGVMSAYCCLHMANTVSLIPGNQNFDKQIEFSDPFRIFWGKSAYLVTQLLFFLCAMCLNIAAIVDTAEVVDLFLGHYGKSYAWSPMLNGTLGGDSLTSWSHPSLCTRAEVKLGECEPFADASIYGEYILTAGYVITAAIILPICLMDLKDNSNWQIFGFFTLLTLSSYFCFDFVFFAQNNLESEEGTTDSTIHHHVSIWGQTWKNMLGVILFNFGLVLAVPAWLHEKKQNVCVKTTIMQSTGIATGLYVGVGILAAVSIPHVSQNMLTPMVSGAYGTGMQVAASVFAFVIIGLDIPLFCVLTRYNLTHSGLLSQRAANWAVVWIPWGISWIFYQGDAIGFLLEWGGVLLTGVVAFILPLYLALYAAQYHGVLINSPESSKSSWWFGSINLYDDSTSVRGCCKILTTSKRKAYLLGLGFLWILATLAVLWALGVQILTTIETDQGQGMSQSVSTPQHHHRHRHHHHHDVLYSNDSLRGSQMTQKLVAKAGH